MKKGTKIALWSMGAITVVGGIYLLWDYFQDKDDYNVSEESKEEKRREVTTNSNKYKSEGDPLKLHSKGDNVKCLQNVLNKLGVKDKNNSALTSDGMFGPLTESATQNAGWGKSVSFDKLRTELQTLINNDIEITCNSSCCGDIAKEMPLLTDSQESLSDDWWANNKPSTVSDYLSGGSSGTYNTQSDNTYVVPPFIPPNLTFSGSWVEN
tara:strand:- start:4263 stop:4892 length:630 start_codon:yes stop_codon:yes gene_type:complete